MLKRFLDIIVAVIFLILMSPVLFVVAILVKLKIGSPILFRQNRPGLNEKSFEIVKFRTMSDLKSKNGQILPDEHRMTRLGCLLRAMSIDELPELWNVLKGDMSLVGPRPLLMQYLPLYNQEQKRRHDVRPGVTGWAQVNGRNHLSWDEKFKLDIWYVNHQSFWLDVKILLLTIKKVFKREGISAQDNVTAPAFTGNDNKGF